MITTLKLPGIIPGLNGKNGLIRSHWAQLKKQKNQYYLEFLSQTKNRHHGPVIIHYHGYKSKLMDWDNFSASFKLIGDALVMAQIIKDDKPEIVIQFLPKQFKCKQKDQHVQIIIEDV
jgi:hypothetical protein